MQLLLLLLLVMVVVVVVLVFIRHLLFCFAAVAASIRTAARL